MFDGKEGATHVFAGVQAGRRGAGKPARAIVAVWRRDYSECRPPSGIGYLTPGEFAARCRNGSPGRAPEPEIG